jgi:hypothetical protein
MSCDLSFSQTSTFLSSSIISVTITVPEVYDCTNIQLRLRSIDSIIEDWFSYAVLSNLETTINFPFPPEACYLDVRLFQCCVVPDVDPDVPASPPGLPPFAPDEPPCAPIATSFEEECSETKINITNPYVRPEDVLVSTDFNEIYIPKKVQLNIVQNSCSDITATLCTVRCAEISIPDIQGDCACNFQPSVDIYSLPKINIGRLPFGVPLDIDRKCSFSSGIINKPQYSEPDYTKVVAYYLTRNAGATPFVDGVGYDISNLNTATWIEVHTTNNSTEMRDWLIRRFRFFTLNKNKEIWFNWPYTDLIWYPYDSCIENNKFTPEDKTVYVQLIPC